MPFRPSRPLLAKMTNYDIVVTSDIVCPWCYIGKTRLGRAIADHKKQYPNDTFSLKYLPFYLQPPPQLVSHGPTPPPFPAPSKPRREMYAQKFGTERAKQIEAMMAQTSKGEGLDFRFGGMTGPSRNGHRLVYWAQGKGGEQSQNEVMLGLWRRYFEQEVDITTLDTLVEIGLEAKLGTKQEITDYLTSGKDGQLVDQLAEEAHMKGISGVPFYEINDMWQVSGAQDPAAFKQLFTRWKELETKGKVPVGGGGTAKGTECL